MQTKKAAAPKGKRIALWIVAVLLALVLVCLLVIWWAFAYSEKHPLGTTQTLPTVVETSPTVLSTVEDVSVNLGSDISITKIGAYTGAFVEDGSNEVLSGVLMLMIVNEGEEAVEYAELVMPTDTGDAHFSVSTLLPGTTMVLLEQNRMAYTGNEQVEQIQVSSVAMFNRELSMCEDQLKLQILDGAINVTNISGKDIEGDVVIYYKNYAQDIYYGGITYRLRIQGGIQANEVKQMTASHFSGSGSRVVFVTVG